MNIDEDDKVWRFDDHMNWEGIKVIRDIEMYSKGTEVRDIIGVKTRMFRGLGVI